MPSLKYVFINFENFCHIGLRIYSTTVKRISKVQTVPAYNLCS